MNNRQDWYYMYNCTLYIIGEIMDYWAASFNCNVCMYIAAGKRQKQRERPVERGRKINEKLGNWPRFVYACAIAFSSKYDRYTYIGAICNFLIKTHYSMAAAKRRGRT